uniref:Ubiquitin carboxyl-terminal hydrolase 1 n=1 Tax=Homo sapiens TaxID=9606 RepID=UPI0020FFF558|nr:Chain B, Ubiquitin carboxyl-terminal hydrolase 1 [Homo sapiens]7AY0_D Chain D, Ubiquitin carboxyl-terminal hydrolase 1 [Homo sapiens]7AY2_B Chain B, Ubiquitin carboxyl-terminal hydrolase 1 [Homo sapiens]7AY2_E Chain E, Ubiquitin carboxyl-terminal hydrolase 1 [Homo sapiens]
GGSPINCEKRENLLPFVGLNNLGNTCYLNSILQVLYFCPGFKSGVKHLFNIISRKKEALKSLASYELICSLQSLIISVEQLQASFLLNPEKYTDELATQPRRLLNTLRELNPMYEGYLQHDAQEVLQCILGNIQETCQLLKKEEVKNVAENEVKPINKGEEQIGFELVEKLFQGQLVLRTRCLECESLTERREDFQDISVPVQEDELSKVEESSEISPEPKTEMKTLRWAISQFASVERIVGEDKYFCENCHHYTEAERSLLFDKMPEVITIHLKCFAASGLEFDCYGGGLSKINTPLLTPLKLSLEEWSTKPTNDSYGLFAVVMHSGITISSGHYTASVKVTDLNSLEQSLKEYEGKWLLFDDSEVKVTEEKDFLNSLSPSTSPTSTPYLLFYKKL